MLLRNVARRSSSAAASAASASTHLRVIPGGLSGPGVAANARFTKNLLGAGRLLKYGGYAWLAASLAEEIWRNMNYQQAEGGAFVVPSGWTEYARGACAITQPVQGIKSTIFENSTIAWLCNNCIDGQAVPAQDQVPITSPAKTTYKSISYGSEYEVPGPTVRMTYVVGYTRDDTAEIDTPYWKWNPAIAYPEIPYQWRQLQSAVPEVMLPEVPYPSPKPVPYHLLPEWTHPERQVDNGPALSPSLPYRPSQVPLDYTRVIEPRTRPGQLYGARPEARLSSFHTLRPPGPREKERKVVATGIAREALIRFNQLTEAGDFVDVLYSAIPDQYKPRYRGTVHPLLRPTPQQALGAIYDNWTHINVADALLGLIAESVEDYTYGQIGQIGADISRSVGFHHFAGANTYLSSSRRLYNQAQEVYYSEDN